jgi:hypothetical protein
MTRSRRNNHRRSAAAPSFLEAVKREMGARFNKLSAEQKKVLQDIDAIKKAGGRVGSNPVT